MTLQIKKSTFYESTIHNMHKEIIAYEEAKKPMGEKMKNYFLRNYDDFNSHLKEIGERRFKNFQVFIDNSQPVKKINLKALTIVQKISESTIFLAVLSFVSVILGPPFAMIVGPSLSDRSSEVAIKVFKFLSISFFVTYPAIFFTHYIIIKNGTTKAKNDAIIKKRKDAFEYAIKPFKIQKEFEKFKENIAGIAVVS